MSIENAPIVHATILPEWMKKERTRVLTSFEEGTSDKPVVYWMQRDVRVNDNWALLYAAWLAQERKVGLEVVYLLPSPPAAATEEDAIPDLEHLPLTTRHGQFLLGGLEVVHRKLAKRHIPLRILMKDHGQALASSLHASAVVCDFSPLRHCRRLVELEATPYLESQGIPVLSVDAHNVVPVWVAADKRQVGARTLRPKIQNVLSQYLQPYPEVPTMDDKSVDVPAFDRSAYETYLLMDDSVPPVDWCQPGTKNGMKQFEFFLLNGLKTYDTHRNDPNHKNVISNMSPWINHGHVSFQRLALEVRKFNKYANGTASFLEEGIIRRELSDNLLYYSPNDYDSLSTAAEWAQATLRDHASDPREYVYSLDEFEAGATHDDLWNAAQLQLVRQAKMHGFLRMYWAKKILEWTESPAVALATAQYLNDKYALDGRDPNGFVGVGWSIMGIHDMGWKEREIFGKIRFMNYNGCKRKFDVKGFVAKYKGASENAVKAAQKHSGGGKRPSTDTTKTAKKQKTLK